MTIINSKRKFNKKPLSLFLTSLFYTSLICSIVLISEQPGYANSIDPDISGPTSSSGKPKETVRFEGLEGSGEQEFTVVDSFEEKVEESDLVKEKRYPGFTGPLGTRYYWDKGLHIVGRYDNLQFMVGGNLYFDTGRVESDSELDRAFPDFDGHHNELRQLRLHTSAILFKALEIRLDLDFTNKKQIMDNWIRFTNIPVLNRFRFGHIKQPFSLEYTTSSRYTTFMERALPILAFNPGRNFGVRYDRGVSDKRFTWSAGAFVITGAAGDFSDLRDQLDEHIGYSLAFRASALPYHSEEAHKLIVIFIKKLIPPQRPSM